MAKHSWIIATMAALIANIFATPPVRAAEKADSKTIAQWITKLGSSNFKDREEATRCLIGIGPAAQDLLEKAAAGKDAEIRRRAESVLDRIERDADTAAQLIPKRIRLNFQDTPVTDAVAELAKKSGFAIQFEGDRTQLASRKITMDTGEVPFWVALDEFCRKAGLVERGPARPKNNEFSANSPEARERMLIERRRLLMARRGLAPAVPNNPDAGRIILVDGKPDSLPRWHAGAVRFRALPPNAPGTGQIKTQEETFFTLEITPEPKLAWQGILDVRISKAVDQAGQSLTKVLPARTPGEELLQDMTAFGLNAMVMNGAILIDSDGEPIDMMHHHRQVPIRFKLAGKPSQVLREVQGTVAAQVQAPHQPLITVENILKAQDRTVKGPERSYLKVLEVRPLDHGQIKLRIEVRPPPGGINGMQMLGGGGRVVFVQQRFNGRMAVMAMQEADNGGAQNLSLQDTKGQPFQLVNIDETPAPNGNGGNQEYQLVFQSRPGLGEASKLVFSGRRLITIEVPFTLKDVPLP